MKAEAYTEHDKWVMDHIAPINVAITTSAAALIPLPDIPCLYLPYIGHVAGLTVLVFLALLVMKMLGILRGKQLQTSTIIRSEVCAAAFSVGAIAGARHIDRGGVIAANVPWVAQLQQTLLDIKDGKSDNPRAGLKNMGVEWTPGSLFQASRDGNTKVMELFLKGGMPVTLSGTGND